MASDSHAEYAQRLLAAVLTSDGDTDPSVRQAVESLSAQIGGRSLFRRKQFPQNLSAISKRLRCMLIRPPMRISMRCVMPAILKTQFSRLL